MSSLSSTVPATHPPVLLLPRSNAQIMPSSHVPEMAVSLKPSPLSTPEYRFPPEIEEYQNALMQAARSRTGPTPEGYVRMKCGVLKKVDTAWRGSWRGVVNPPDLNDQIIEQLARAAALERQEPKQRRRAAITPDMNNQINKQLGWAAELERQEPSQERQAAIAKLLEMKRRGPQAVEAREHDLYKQRREQYFAVAAQQQREHDKRKRDEAAIISARRRHWQIVLRA